MPPIYRKLLAIAVMTLALLLPQAAISNLVDERQARQKEASDALDKDFALDGEVRGPLLQIPTRTLAKDGKWEISGQILLRPREARLVGDLDVGLRYRGIYQVPVYQGKVEFDAVFVVPESGDRGEVLDFDWEHARVHAFLSKDFMLAEPGVLEAGGATGRMTIGDTLIGRSVVSVSSYLPGTGFAAGRDLPVKVTLGIRGAQNVRFTPLAETVSGTLRSNWASPSFVSGWLPDNHDIGDKGFTAEFRSSMLPPDVDLALQSGRMDVWTSRARSFGVNLIDPASHYVQASRAVKYAALFVVLTFLTFFLFEVLAGVRLHPIQYLTVGAALVLFFLLLLSLSEQLAFGWSYLISAMGVIAIIAGYARSILASPRRAGAIAAGLASLYGFLFVLLQLESYSLISGSLALFAVLAAFMYLTRRVDWYGIGPKGASATAVP